MTSTMDINLQEHGYAGNISIPITINISLPGITKPGAPETKPNPTPVDKPKSPAVQKPAAEPKPDAKAKETPHTALGIFGDSIAEFLNGEHGTVLGDMINLEHEFAEPPLNEYKREEIDQAIKQVGQQVALDIGVGLLDKLLAALAGKEPKTPKEDPKKPEKVPTDPTSKPDEHEDGKKPEDPKKKKPIEPVGPGSTDPTPKGSIAGQELADYLTKFVDDHLTEFYTHGADDSHVKSVIQKAEELAEQLPAQFKVPAELVPKLATLGLYDVFVLLDDSGSMNELASLQAAKETTVGLFEIATAINPNACEFSLVPYDNGNLEDLASIKSVTDLTAKFDKIQFNTGMSPDGPLGLKIFSPLTTKAGKQQLARPVFILIISDGKESDGQAQLLITRITEFIANLKAHGYSSPEGLKMAIVNVAPGAKNYMFFPALQASTDVKDTLYIVNENPSRDKAATILSNAMTLGLKHA